MTQILEMSANNKLSLWLSWKETTEEYFLEKPENVFDNNFLGASQVGCKKKIYLLPNSKSHKRKDSG